jgi:hypothetical protein
MPFSGKRRSQIKGDKQPVEPHDQFRNGHVKQGMSRKECNGGVYFGERTFSVYDQIGVVTDGPTDIGKFLVIGFNNIDQVIKCGKKHPFVLSFSPVINDRKKEGKGNE